MRPLFLALMCLIIIFYHHVARMPRSRFLYPVSPGTESVLPFSLKPTGTIGASPLLSETVIRVSRSYQVNSLLIGTSYTGLEAFKYVTSAIPEQR